MDDIKSLSSEQQLRLECMRIGVDFAAAIIQARVDINLDPTRIANVIYEYVLNGISSTEQEGLQEPKNE
jgi:hypothetical protein